MSIDPTGEGPESAPSRYEPGDQVDDAKLNDIALSLDVAIRALEANIAHLEELSQTAIDVNRSPDIDNLKALLDQLKTLQESLSSGHVNIAEVMAELAQMNNAAISRSSGAADQFHTAFGEFKADSYEYIFEKEERARAYYHAALNQWGDDFSRETTDATYATARHILGDDIAGIHAKYPQGALIVGREISKEIEEDPEAARTINAAEDAKPEVDALLEDLFAKHPHLKNHPLIQKMMKEHGTLSQEVIDFIEANPKASAAEIAAVVKNELTDISREIFKDARNRFDGDKSDFDRVLAEFTDEEGNFSKDKIKQAYADLSAKLQKLHEAHPNLSPDELIRKLSPEDQTRLEAISSIAVAAQVKSAEMILEITQNQEIAQGLDKNFQQLAYRDYDLTTEEGRNQRAADVWNMVVRTVNDTQGYDNRMLNNPNLRAFVMKNADQITDGESLARVLREAAQQESVDLVSVEEMTQANLALAAHNAEIVKKQLESIQQGAGNPELRAKLHTMLASSHGYFPAELQNYLLEREYDGTFNEAEFATALDALEKEMLYVGQKARQHGRAFLQSSPGLLRAYEEAVASGRFDPVTMQGAPEGSDYAAAFKEIKRAVEIGDLHNIPQETLEKYVTGRVRGETEAATALLTVITHFDHAAENGEFGDVSDFFSLGHEDQMSLIGRAIPDSNTYGYHFLNTTLRNLQGNSDEAKIWFSQVSQEVKLARSTGDEAKIKKAEAQFAALYSHLLKEGNAEFADMERTISDELVRRNQAAQASGVTIAGGGVQAAAAGAATTTVPPANDNAQQPYELANPSMKKAIEQAKCAVAGCEAEPNSEGEDESPDKTPDTTPAVAEAEKAAASPSV